METKLPHMHIVPWTTYDVWIGVALLAWWLIMSIAFSVAIYFLSWNVEPGIFITLWELFLVVPVWWIAVHRRQANWSALGLRPFEGVDIAVGCGLMLLSYVFNFLYNSFFLAFEVHVQPDFVPLFVQTSRPWLLIWSGALIAPVAEEIFFRGFVFGGLRQRYGWQRAALISSALFAVVHLRLTSLPPLFILGFIFAFLYQRSNSIWPAILMHAMTNSFGLGAAYMLSKMNPS